MTFFRGRLPVVSTLVVLLAGNAQAADYDQWIFYALSDSSQKFDTESEAAEHMRSLSLQRSYLTIRGPITIMNRDWAYRSWYAPDEPPFYTDEWDYWINGSHHTADSGPCRPPIPGHAGH
jgi:hypothetical protein